MIHYTQLQRFKLSENNNLTNADFLNLINNNSFVEPPKFALSSYGWQPQFEARIVDSNISSAFVSGIFIACKRDAPKELVKRMMQQRIRSQQADSLSKADLINMESDIRNELNLDVPPAEFKAATFYIEDIKELWVLANKKDSLEEIALGVLYVLRNAGFSFKHCKFDVCSALFKQLANNNLKNSGLNVVGAKVKQGQKTLTLDANMDEDFKHSILSNSDSVFERVSLGSDVSDIQMTVMRNGTINSIAALPGFRQSWYENGDPEDPEFLHTICTAIWVQQVSCIIQTISNACNAYHEGSAEFLTKTA